MPGDRKRRRRTAGSGGSKPAKLHQSPADRLDGQLRASLDDLERVLRVPEAVERGLVVRVQVGMVLARGAQIRAPDLASARRRPHPQHPERIRVEPDQRARRRPRPDHGAEIHRVRAEPHPRRTRLRRHARTLTHGRAECYGFAGRSCASRRTNGAAATRDLRREDHEAREQGRERRAAARRAAPSSARRTTPSAAGRRGPRRAPATPRPRPRAPRGTRRTRSAPPRPRTGRRRAAGRTRCDGSRGSRHTPRG